MASNTENHVGNINVDQETKLFHSNTDILHTKRFFDISETQES